ncbi:hypothetical protein TTHERM_00310380 (macronuclear) [Tetrahymena thermophila SB210]|uniref:Uncharacterized protein n=1 Tax=Tetrahymena thermophila (strain SB210) TaxID=312017 RepID=I7M963_TETTS|nr:hypothetical protein TTHERM_00310380 [Tetrahymena thermophila SB210]EAS00868.1 hypothetical protein TTHERM_00310380 [Tetrahymena thermophila SB210]|eukprot:XP_001021113.1 hypothetical protein TTHERM_00310380 [Tetrahymena thermophila SB210]
MYQAHPLITISPMQSKLFSYAKQAKHTSKGTVSFNSLPLTESSLSRVTSSGSRVNTNSSYNGTLSLSNFKSSISNSSKFSNASKFSNQSNISNSYIHTEFDENSQRLKSCFVDKQVEEGIYTGASNNIQQSVITLKNYKKRFYNNLGQLKPGVAYNKYYGQNDLEIEEFEETYEPYSYYKISSKNGEIISTSNLRPKQIVSMIQKNQYIPTN